MRNRLTIITLLVLFICLCRTDQGLCTESIYIWKLENSEVRITNKPPPKKAKVIEVIRYQSQPGNNRENIQLKQEQETFDRDEAAAVEVAQKARKAADDAWQKAEEAKKKADDARKKADTLIDELGPISIVNRQFTVKVDQAKALAKETKELATQAELEAMKAEERVREAESQALQFTEKPSPANAGESGKAK